MNSGGLVVKWSVWRVEVALHRPVTCQACTGQLSRAAGPARKSPACWPGMISMWHWQWLRKSPSSAPSEKKTPSAPLPSTAMPGAASASAAPTGSPRSLGSPARYWRRIGTRRRRTWSSRYGRPTAARARKWKRHGPSSRTTATCRLLTKFTWVTPISTQHCPFRVSCRLQDETSLDCEISMDRSCLT
jgi:hypothetical protein